MTNKKKTIAFTGGGSAGHVTPNLALIKKFKAEGWDVIYFGSPAGIEKELIAKINIPYYEVTSGKLRRYFSWQNFIDPFKILLGIMQAWFHFRNIKPKVLFSKGGFVAFPVIVAAWIRGIPIVAHESDFSPGLANKLSFPFVKKICLTFEDAKKYFKQQEKLLVTGTPLREELFRGDPQRGKQFCNLKDDKPIILVFGGGLGSEAVNQAIRNLLPQLLNEFNIIHICGKGKTLPNADENIGYKQYEYIHEELPDVLACADVVVSRAGANSLYELIALRKPHVLVPLSKKASRGDQILNANYFSEKQISYVVKEEELTSDKLLSTILQVAANQKQIQEKISTYPIPDSVEVIYDCITNFS